MKASVYYVNLNDNHRLALNSGGWNGPEGQAYLNARDGDYQDAQRLGMLDEVAVVQANDAEDIWVALQNGVNHKAGLVTFETRKERIRSMDLGDLVFWEDGRVERVAGSGFKPVAGLTLRELTK